MVRLYGRVLGFLKAERRLAIGLAATNVVLAVAAFAEPLLMGRIIDQLTHLKRGGDAMGTMLPLLAAWVAFGFFTIAAGVFIALHADRLAHRNRLSSMASYFEHVLDLPLAFHSANHSGRVLKAMLEGTNGMAWLWLGFFRDHLVALVSLGVLLPMTLFINWQLGSILVVLVLAFTALTTFVMRRTEALQGQVEEFNSGLAAHASDALGNVAVIQSFTRAKAEKEAMRGIIEQPARRADPGPVLVGARQRRDPRLGDHHHDGDLRHRHLALPGRHHHGGRGRGLHEPRHRLRGARLDHVVGFVNGLFQQAPKIAEFFEIYDTVPAVADRPHARQVARFEGEVTFEDVAFSYDGRRSALDGVSFSARPGETIALVGTTGSGKSTTLGLLHRSFDPAAGAIRIDGMDIRDVGLASLRHNIGVVFQEPMLFARSIRENLQVGCPDATDAEMLDALERAQASAFMARQPDGLDTVDRRARPLAVGRRAPAALDRPGAPEEPADPDPRRGDLGAGRRHRAQAPGRAGDRDGGADHLRDRPPPRDDPRRRPHPGVPRGPDRRGRDLRRAGGRGRPLRRTRPGAVHGRGGGGRRRAGARRMRPVCRGHAVVRVRRPPTRSA